MSNRYSVGEDENNFNQIDWKWYVVDDDEEDIDPFTLIDPLDYPWGSDSYLYVGHDAPFMDLFFSQYDDYNIAEDYVADDLYINDVDLEYWNGSEWIEFDYVSMFLDRYLDPSDGTYLPSSKQKLFYPVQEPWEWSPRDDTYDNYCGTGFIWKPLTDWEATEVNGRSAYWIRIGPGPGGAMLSADNNLVPKNGFSYKNREFDTDDDRILSYCLGLFGESSKLCGDELIDAGGVIGLFMDREAGRSQLVVRRWHPRLHMFVNDLVHRGTTLDNYEGFFGNQTFVEARPENIRADYAIQPTSGEIWFTSSGHTPPITWDGNQQSEAAVETASAITDDYTDAGVVLRSTVPSAHFITIHDGLIFLADEERIYWNQPGSDYQVWPEDNYIYLLDNDGSPITGMTSYNGALIVFKRDSIWQITFSRVIETGLSEYRHQKIADIGCVSHQTIVSTDDSLYWLSENGIQRLKMGQIQDLSEPIREYLNNTSKGSWGTACAAYWKERREVYFCLPNDSYQNDIAFVYDVDTGSWWKDDNYEAAAICYAEEKDDTGKLCFFNYENMFFEFQDQKTDASSGLDEAITGEVKSHEIMRNTSDRLHWRYCYVSGKNKGSFNLTFDIIADSGRILQQITVPMSEFAQDVWGDGSEWTDLDYDSPKFQTLRLNLKNASRSRSIKISNSGIDEDFEISDLEFLVRERGNI